MAAPRDIEPVALGEIAEATAREAGALLLARRDAVRAALPSVPNDADLIASADAAGLLTAIDRAAEELIVRHILAARPGDDIVAEEGTSIDGGPVRWIIDPIDGTANYLRGIPHFSVSIAAELDGVAIAGVVYNPVIDELFRAVRGEGAVLNGRPIHVSSEERLSHAVVATGLGNAGNPVVAQQHLDRLEAILPRIADLRRTGSAALDLCWVACGRVEAYYEDGQYPWDVAAGDLIVREAGGVSGTVDGAPLDLDRVWLAANATLFEPVRALIASAGNGR